VDVETLRRQCVLKLPSCNISNYVSVCVISDRFPRETVSTSFTSTVVGLAAAGLHTPANELSDVNTMATDDDDDYGYGPDHSG